MIGDVFVIDGVAHSLNWDPGNIKLPGPPPDIHRSIHIPLSVKDPRYLMTPEQFNRKHDPETLVSCLFAESQTDMACYHHLTVLYAVKEDMSPMETAKAAAELAPGRVLVKGGLSNVFDTKRAIDEIDRHIEENHIIGLKFFPLDWDGSNGDVRNFRLDDEKYAFPLIEHAQKRGLRVITIHKAIGVSVKALGVGDLEDAAMAFPAMNFEIVHGGWAFLDETLMLAALPNIYINLEQTSSLLEWAPRRFAELLGRLCQGGIGRPEAEDRIVWATGALLVHPQPYLEKFWAFQIPEDMVEGQGYPPLTEEIKRKILAENFARMHGLDLKALAAGIPNDEMRRRQLAGELAKPWSKAPVAA